MAAQAKLKSRYEIKEILGQGGKGVVYRAYDTVIRRDVALKTVRDIPDPAARNVSERVRRATIMHKIFDGKAWVMLDELKFPGADSTVGKFGMFVPGKDQVGLSQITFKPI
jgi:hypothetical protein